MQGDTNVTADLGISCISNKVNPERIPRVLLFPIQVRAKIPEHREGK